jgi:uncharacterized protein YbjT (DUF2867 family)
MCEPAEAAVYPPGMTVLVAGASGTTGSEVVAQLRAAGVSVRALSRTREKAEALRSDGVEPVVASFDDPASLAAALDGVSAAYLVTNPSPDTAATEGAFARATHEAGAHLVKLSVVGADPDAAIRFARAHGESEAAIEQIGGSWTFVRPNGFMQNDLAWAAQIPSGVIRGPVMDARWSIVDVVDVAAVAVAALATPAEHVGKRITVTGPEPLTPRERVSTLAEILVRELAVEELPVAAVKEQLAGFGVDAWTADALEELWGIYAEGYAADVSTDVEHVLGRRAGSWEAFVVQHEAAFRAA